MSGFDVHLADARRSRSLIFFVAVGAALLLTVGFLISRDQSDPRLMAQAQTEMSDDTDTASEPAQTPDPATSPLEALDTPPQTAVMAEHALFTNPNKRPAVHSVDVTVRRGQTFASVLADAGADRVDAARAINALDPLYSARLLRAGQDLTLYFETPAPYEVQQTFSTEPSASTTRLAGLSFRPDQERTLTVSRDGNGQFHAREATASLRREVVRVTGEVSSSLYLSAIELGATDRVVFELANILGFAVDFRTVQPGDPFDVVFERFVNSRGETVRTGEILYVVFDGRGDPLEYFRYEMEDGEIGYYTGEGESAQRLLMRMPINGARISSSFGMRFHPVLNRNRPHNGTDFAAPRGTPVMAAGAGIVERANRFGSFGNYVRIRHANGYQTAYAHLQGFASGVRSGTRVQQGQIIAYVGTTGRSTGPHLHYEVHLNGNPTNPMSLDLPTGRRLEANELEDFMQVRDELIELRDNAPAALEDESSQDAILTADNAGDA
ncbi:M23 family metallopeptidase [Oceanicaulis sp. MMSF_3324]|uniref:M23 family metallopeptidase n=1 Tax=Oceanicaulis sp. MMSF_3324 TaxID=3046702 RepID=UPI00273EA299|nr:M23 family metallopeptidase [Oceanicaulis sp. MMSF_3324]